jgi:hypothetical protein
LLQGCDGIFDPIGPGIVHVVSGERRDMESGALQSRQIVRIAGWRRDVRGILTPPARMRDLHVSNQHISFLQSASREIEK